MPESRVPETRSPSIKDLPPEGRPRERLVARGARELSLAELLAVILGTGNAASGETALDLANRILAWAGGRDGGLTCLVHAGVEELITIPGIGMAKAVQVKAALELGRRLGRPDSLPVEITSPEDAFRLVGHDLAFREEEHLQVILLTTKNGVLGVDTVARGGLNSWVVAPREVFRPAIRRNAASLILAHNHPSGDPSPSAEDYVLTEYLLAGGRVLGIDVLDHLVVGHEGYVSLRETPRGWNIWTREKGEPGQ